MSNHGKQKASSNRMELSKHTGLSKLKESSYGIESSNRIGLGKVKESSNRMELSNRTGLSKVKESSNGMELSYRTGLSKVKKSSDGIELSKHTGIAAEEPYEHLHRQSLGSQLEREDSYHLANLQHSKHGGIPSSFHSLSPRVMHITSPATNAKYNEVIEQLSRIHQDVPDQISKQIQTSNELLYSHKGDEIKVDLGTQYEPFEQKSETHFLLALFGFLCCPILSVMSLRASCRVRAFNAAKDRDEALRYSSQAQKLGLAAVFIGMTMYIVLIYIFVKHLNAVWW